MYESIAKIITLVLSFPKTAYANFKYLPFSQAIRLPVFVHWNSSLAGNGRFIIHRESTGCIRIGTQDMAFPSKKLTLCVTGTLEFNGKAFIGTGSEIVVRGRLTIGDNFSCSSGCKIDAKAESSFGNNVLIGHNCTFIDDDGHKLLQEGKRINDKVGYHIGNNIWFGRECLVLKGTTTSSNIVFGARSLIRGQYDVENVVYGGSPAKIIKSNIDWER